MTIHIYHPTDRTAVHAHSNLQAGMRFERTTDFNRALRRRFLTSVEDQRHAVAGWNFYQSTRSFRFLVLIRTADDRRQLVNYRPLFVNRKLRVTNNVDEEDMRDFEPNLLFNLGGHVMNLPENRTIDNSASRRRSRPKVGSAGPDLAGALIPARRLWNQKNFTHLSKRLPRLPAAPSPRRTGPLVLDEKECFPS